MRRISSHRAALAALLTAILATVVSPSRAQETPAPSPVSAGMKIVSCTVASIDETKQPYDCSPRAAELCNGKDLCEIQIGYNLTDGKDIDPTIGVVGKLVSIRYACGAIIRQRGPYNQNDHATLILECNGPL